MPDSSGTKPILATPAAVSQAAALMADPTPMTTAQLDKAIINIEERQRLISEAIRTEIAAVANKAEALHSDYVRVPTLLDRATTDIKELVKSWLDTHDAKRSGIKELFESWVEAEAAKRAGSEHVVLGRLDRVGVLFEELEKRAKLESNLNSTALAAALQAQKEQYVTQNNNFVLAINKLETSITQQLATIAGATNKQIENINDKVNAITGRLDRGEGRTDVKDPATAAALSSLWSQIQSGGYKNGASNNALIVTIIAAAALVFLGLIISGAILVFAK